MKGKRIVSVRRLPSPAPQTTAGDTERQLKALSKLASSKCDQMLHLPHPRLKQRLLSARYQDFIRVLVTPLSRKTPIPACRQAGFNGMPKPLTWQ